MAGRIMRIHPDSPERVDELLDKCKALAVGEHVVVTVYMRLSPPVNKKCPFCDSGKKWKKCRCKEEDSDTLTFYPEGYKLRRPRSRLDGIIALAMANAWIDRRN